MPLFGRVCSRIEKLNECLIDGRKEKLCHANYKGVCWRCGGDLASLVVCSYLVRICFATLMDFID